MGLFDIFKISKIKGENERLNTLLLEKEKKLTNNTSKINELQKKLDDLGVTEFYEIQSKIKKQNEELNNITIKNTEVNKLNLELNEQLSKLNKSVETQTRKISKIKELYKSIDYSINMFINTDTPLQQIQLNAEDLDTISNLSPSVILKLHSMDVKSLRKEFRNNDKLINDLLEKYSSRYTTKANKAIYNLMVIALKAELQNVLYNLKYEKLDECINDVKKITLKYLKIAGEGNQSILGTLTKFIGEIEYLFINAVKIEYNYYLKKEQARQEQLAIKQQMREQAEEQKMLAQQQKKIEKEEEKFNTEINKITEILNSSTDSNEVDQLKARILELQSQLNDVESKKEEIAKLQNGKAGNVYVISNMGSFGENIFKIGMTRRMNPQERVDELGNASVPFKFDVHSFIFSDDAVNLEKRLHTILNEKRVNKINLRKEFFNINIDELENIVNEVDPTAEFNKTILAEEFRQSQFE
ncbi:GIY-YIG nuclease family protein [Clostridium massiliodielmoense]|uniref:GIY-YIG nuclease family protein n=1 Tax=Clostridium massiliodielmoense TaxID=1776385 RepID=UPI001A9A50AB|nr:GIY-YIG nuclease family protein [Clostridium massiliodielmoense]